jgi:outer membrane murein-binding lipoprotein Lpp
MMIVALVLFAAVIVACMLAPTGGRAKKHAAAPAVASASAKQPAMQVGEARA